MIDPENIKLLDKLEELERAALAESEVRRSLGEDEAADEAEMDFGSLLASEANIARRIWPELMDDAP